jgi:hypothetical protein
VGCSRTSPRNLLILLTLSDMRRRVAVMDPLIEEIGYRVSANHNNARAYRQFFGKESRTAELHRSTDAFRSAFRFMRDLMQRKP